jgi:hypothetical protein
MHVAIMQNMLWRENERETEDIGKEWKFKNGNIEGAHVGEPGNVKELDKDQEPCEKNEKEKW